MVVVYKDLAPEVLLFRETQRGWNAERLSLPDQGSIQIYLSSPLDSMATLTHQSFLDPISLIRVSTKEMTSTKLIQDQSAFDPSELEVIRYSARASDGESIPYYLVRPASQEAALPILLYAYGNSDTHFPVYSGSMGRLWLRQGGGYVLAAIRGGGELGPEWEEAGRGKETATADVLAVAADLIKRKITVPGRIAVQGHSVGGVTMGGAINMRPDLFGAAVLENPVLDLLDENVGWSGYQPASFPRVAPGLELQTRKRLSPLQNSSEKLADVAPLVTTSTSDPHVRPYWARKYVAKLLAAGVRARYFEAPVGGHNAHGFTPVDAAFHDALVFSYLRERLMFDRRHK
jgi:prolyl oligopeptidase